MDLRAKIEARLKAKHAGLCGGDETPRQSRSMGRKIEGSGGLPELAGPDLEQVGHCGVCSLAGRR